MVMEASMRIALGNPSHLAVALSRSGFVKGRVERFVTCELRSRSVITALVVGER